MEFVFRRSRRYWIENISVILMLALLTGLAWWIGNTYPRILYLRVMAAIFTALMIANTLSELRTRIEINPLGMKGRLNSQRFDFQWTEVQAVQMVTNRLNKPELQFGTQNDAFILPLKDFDADTVWQAIEHCVPATILAPDALLGLPWVKAQLAEQDALISGSSGVVSVAIRPLNRVIGWLSLSVITGLAAIAWWQGAFYWAAIFLLPFALMALYLLYTVYARIEITPELVRLVMPLWPTYAMRWDDVTHVKEDQQENVLVLYGKHKRLPLPGQTYWHGKDRARFRLTLFAHLQRMEVPQSYSQRANFALPKNVRVSRKE